MEFAGGILVGGLIGFALGRLVRLAHRDNWRVAPPTLRQIEYADDLGIQIPPGCTRGEHSNLISRAVAEGR